MTKLKRLKTLLQRGYFPAELPPPFFTDTFAHYRTSILKAWAMHKSPNTKPEAYNYPRIGHARRSLAIVNPVSFIHLAKLIADSWPTLRTHMRKSRIATSIPEIIEDGERAISKPDFAGAEKMSWKYTATIITSLRRTCLDFTIRCIRIRCLWH